MLQFPEFTKAEEILLCNALPSNPKGRKAWTMSCVMKAVRLSANK